LDDSRKKFLIAKALWEFTAEDSKRPIERQSPNDVADMNAILDDEYPALLSTLMSLEPHKKRH
jgi:hypothetical protein